MITRRDSAPATITRAGGKYRSHISRTGEQIYSDVSGVSRTEIRDASEVFHPDSIASLEGVRVQISHAAGAPSVGVARGPARRVRGNDGHEYLECVLEITDAAARARIDSGSLGGLSAGYSCEMVGNRQVRIRFDHIALLDAAIERPRCGEHCRVHFDSINVPQPRKQQSMSQCPCPDPRFFGKSDAYISAYLEIEAKLAAERGTPARVDATERRDVVESRTDADVHAAHVARMQRVYTDSLGKDSVGAEPHHAPASAEPAYNPPPRAPREDASSRIDSMAAAARVDADAVRDVLDARTTRPTVADVESAIHSVRLAQLARSMFGGGK